jgi:hypothetical protein
MLTLMNAGNATATISNQSGLSTTANRIITGQGADMLVGPNQSVLMVYDSGSNRWRVVGGAGGGMVLQLFKLCNFTAEYFQL